MCEPLALGNWQGPGALLRGGDFDYGTVAGPLAVDGFIEPSVADSGGGPGGVGFRCAR